MTNDQAPMTNALVSNWSLGLGHWPLSPLPQLPPRLLRRSRLVHQPHHLFGVAEGRLGIDDANLLVGVFADRVAVLDDRAVLEDVAGQPDQPLAQLAGRLGALLRLELHVAQGL